MYITGHILFTEKIYALVPLHHPLAKQKNIHLIDLRGDQFVLFPEGFILRNMAIDACRQAGFAPLVSTEGEDLDAIKGLVSEMIEIICRRSQFPSFWFNNAYGALHLRKFNRNFDRKPGCGFCKGAFR